MGNWKVQVLGLGAHHNSKPVDADYLTKVFVWALKNAGHRIHVATFESDSTPEETVTGEKLPEVSCE